MLRRFGDVAVNPDQVVCVSRKVAKFQSEKSGDDEEGIIRESEDRSSMIVKIDGMNLQIEISEQAADDLLDYFARNGKPKPARDE